MKININLIKGSKPITNFVRFFLGYLNQFDKAYISGSAVWRLNPAIDNFNIMQNDIDFLLDFSNMEKILLELDRLVKFLKMTYSIEKKSITTKDDYIFYEHYIYKVYTYKININNELNIDLLFIEDIKHFIESKADIDIGMLIYKIKSDELLSAGKGKGKLEVEFILEQAANKTITMKYIIKNKSFQTTYMRLLKYINYGFSIDITNIRLLQYIMYILNQSFGLNYRYKYNDSIITNTNKECGRQKFFCCTCKIKKFEPCLTKQGYDFAKSIYIELIKINYVFNTYNDKMVQYALIMNDYEFALYLIDLYYPSRCCRINIFAIPAILRKINNIELTAAIIDKLCVKNLINYYVCFSCDFSAVKIFQAFIIDTLAKQNYSYYFKLIKLNPIFDVHIKSIHGDLYKYELYKYEHDIIRFLLKKKCRLISGDAINIILKFMMSVSLEV